MEKVTKDLRRAPNAVGARALEPSAPAPSPPPQRTAPPSAPTTPPGRAIEREAQQTAPARADSAMLEYGRQLDLPDRIPPAKAAPPREEPRHVEPRREPTPVMPSTAPAPATQSSTIVVPITFPPAGQTGEIVIRIVLKPAE
jgi:hypothetical protein